MTTRRFFIVTRPRTAAIILRSPPGENLVFLLHLQLIDHTFEKV